MKEMKIKREKIYKVYHTSRGGHVMLYDPDLPEGERRIDYGPATCQRVHELYGGHYRISRSGESCHGAIEDPVPIIIPVIHRRSAIDIYAHIPQYETDEGYLLYIFAIVGDYGEHQCLMAVIPGHRDDLWHEVIDYQDTTIFFSTTSDVVEFIDKAEEVRHLDPECEKKITIGLRDGSEVPYIAPGSFSHRVWVHGHTETGRCDADIPGPDYARVSGAACHLRQVWDTYRFGEPEARIAYPGAFSGDIFGVRQDIWHWYRVSDGYLADKLVDFIGCDIVGHPQYRTQHGDVCTLHRYRIGGDILFTSATKWHRR